MKLTTQLRQDSGYEWVMMQLRPLTPFGRDLARAAGWYGPGEKTALEEELGNIALACGQHARHGSVFATILNILIAFRDIKGSLGQSRSTPMDEVELFEIKHFLLSLSRLEEAYARIPAFAGLTFICPDALLDALDPNRRRLPNFSPAEFDPGILSCGREEADERELVVRRALTGTILEQKKMLLSNMAAVGRLDLILAKARLAWKYGCAKPEITTKKHICAREMTHPAVAAALAEREVSFTPVSITLSGGTTVITGANMGGKSVALKTVTLNLLLMQTGFFVFAEAFSAPLFDEAALVCTDNQSVEQGLSSFGAEVRTVDEVLKRNRGRFFFLALDEFARGTNPREGAVLARTLTEYLTRLDCIAVLTTHYDGVSQAAGAHYQVSGLSGLDDAVLPAGEDPLSHLSRMMDYRLRPAGLDDPCPRDALKVCRLLGLEDDFIGMLSKHYG